VWVKTLSRRITLLTEWMIHKGFDRVSERFGPEFFVRNHKSENSIVTADVYWDDVEIKEKAELIAKKYGENKDFLRNLSKVCCSYCDAVMSESYRISKMDLSKESNEVLLDLFRLYVDKFNDLDVVMFIVFPVEMFLTQRVLKVLRERFKGENESKIQEYFGILTVLPKESEAFLEQRDLLEISIMLKDRLQDEELRKRIKEHAIKFGWMGVSDNSLLGDTWEDDYFIERMEKVENPNEKLKILLNNRQKEIESYKKLIGTLDKNIIGDVEILQDFIYLRTYRITALKKAQINIKPLIREISKRFAIAFEDIVWFKPNEIESLLIDRKIPDFEGRKRGYTVIRENGVVRLEESIDHAEDVKSVETIKGIAANRGKAEGIVKIIYSAKDVNKMEKGDILVTRMTVPDMIMAIEKAAAIITDEGGVTSHAVIISRELGKPCIIATKIATKVLKDGDRVRVDAERGIVEKINFI
jgi:phosphoenolpyruvate synthase/pyruvate phosphate dikinase